MNAYADRLAIDVVSAPLAEIDRRTLSQAWYSALNLAHDTSVAAASPTGSASAVDVGPAAVPPDGSETTARARSKPLPHVESQSTSSAKSELQVDRRRVPDPLARRIERALVRPAALPHRATVTLQGRAGRVELLLRTSGRTTHVIAVCAPGEHARVVQALAHARFALARRGISLQARAQSGAR